jgi:hypothetical protein
MQAVEDFVLQRVNEKPANDVGALGVNDRRPEAQVSRVMSSAPHAVALHADQGSDFGAAD